MQSLLHSSGKKKAVNSQQLVHDGLTRILVEDALQNLKIPITWWAFRDLLVDDNIKTLIYDVIPFVNMEEEKQEEEDTELDGDEIDEEGNNTEDDAKTK